MNEYLEFIIDKFKEINIEISTRKMFGGIGISLGSIFFATIFDNEIYLKVDDSNREDYEKYNMTPFRYPFARKRPLTLQYYKVPVEVLEDSELFLTWVEKSINIAKKSKK